MASTELRKLWKLHQIDAAIYEIRKRAAALDPGEKQLAQIEALEKELSVVGGKAKQLSGELTDLELKQRTLADKIKKIEDGLYSGKIVSPREVADLQKEIDQIRKQRASSDERILELYEVLPGAKAAAAEVESRISQAKIELSNHRKAAFEIKAKLEEAFKKNTAARPEAAKGIEAGLMARYEAIRTKHGTGMAGIKNGFCEGCGNRLPERTLQALKDDKTATCEQCHRLLYYTEGLV